MVFRERGEEETENGETVSRNNRMEKVLTGNPLISVVIIAMRKVIAGPIVANILLRRCIIKTHVLSAGNQAIG